MLRSRLLPVAAGVTLALAALLAIDVRSADSASGETEDLRKIEEAFRYITQAYVERVDSAQLAEDAIEGMLAGLDPHSVYISADEMRSVRESFNASFEGIGIYYEFVPGREGRDTLVVLMPIAGGPSDEAGLMAGDRIVQIDDTTSVGLDTELVQRYLKGPRGTQVRLVVERPGYSAPLRFTITRDRIPLHTVIASYMVDEQTGYVRLQRFARTSHDEVRQAIETLQRQGMQRLVFDLRGNAGGLLDQAYEIADEFLPAGDMIVYTDSRHPSNRRQYRATAGGVFERGAVIVLVDENSASASEIVAGALQDHDRGLLVGRRTFGKGLVQQQFPMTDGSVLQMTVSRYYTPSGRLIQTPYHVGDDEESYFAAKTAIREAVEDALAPNGGMVDGGRFRGADVPDSLVFRTDGGRTVYGGGGILPDYLVRQDTLPPALRTVIGRNLDDQFARAFAERPGFRAQWEGQREAFLRQFRLGDDGFDAFLDFAGTHGTPVVAVRPPTASVSSDTAAVGREAILVRSEAQAARAEIETRIVAFLARRLFDAEAFYPVIGRTDPVLREALRQWDAAVALASRR